MELVEEGQNLAKITPNPIKYQEFVEKGDEDLISVLPDNLLLEILSRLPSTKDAIRTGTLSKRWKHLWTLVPTLLDYVYFWDYEAIEEEMLKEFVVNLRHVKELKIGFFCSQVVSRLVAKGFTVPSNVKLANVTHDRLDSDDSDKSEDP